jgi:hypothetical protein
MKHLNIHLRHALLAQAQCHLAAWTNEAHHCGARHWRGLDATECAEVTGGMDLSSGRRRWMERCRDGRHEYGQVRAAWCGGGATSSTGRIHPATAIERGCTNRAMRTTQASGWGWTTRSGRKVMRAMQASGWGWATSKWEVTGRTPEPHHYRRSFYLAPQTKVTSQIIKLTVDNHCKANKKKYKKWW